MEIWWEGGARSELTVKLNARGPDRYRLGEDTVELIRRLAEHHPDEQIASILNRQGRRTGKGLPFTRPRVQAARFRAGIPAAPPPDPASDVVTIQQAADELGVTVFTIRRWLQQGLLPGEQSAPTRPGGSGSPTKSAHGSCPTCPTGSWRSTTPHACSAALARRCCTRSNAGSCGRFR